MGYRHRPRTQGPPERAAKLLPHIHWVFGNLKTWLRGTHHGVGHDHLQLYLDEFAFRFNRRRTPMAAFQTLLGLASGIHGPTTYDMLHRSGSPDRHKVASEPYYDGMRAVGLKGLKNRLSEDVRLAANGVTVLVTDRDRVVAELVPPQARRERGHIAIKTLATSRNTSLATNGLATTNAT